MIRQEMLNIIDLFTAQPIINFYENIFDNIDLSDIPEFKILNSAQRAILNML